MKLVPREAMREKRERGKEEKEGREEGRSTGAGDELKRDAV